MHAAWAGRRTSFNITNCAASVSSGMEINMIKYFQMKKKEVELKLMVYSYMCKLFKETENYQESILISMQKFASIPEDEIKNILLENIAKIAYKQTNLD